MHRDREAAIAVDDLGVMDRQVGNLKRLMDDLLDVTRMKLGKMRLSTAPIDLETVVKSAVESVRADLDAKGHRLSVEMPADTSA
jgi:signal transduction histidine kinase